VTFLSVLLDVSGYNPDPSGIPGAGTFMSITNWLGFLGEIGCLFGFVLCVVIAVVGRMSGNSGVAAVGALVSVPCLIGAILIANAQNLVNAFIHVGLR
jgi:hypothetical protein